METDEICILENIYPNTDEKQEQQSKHLLDDSSTKTSIVIFCCKYIYNCLLKCFSPSHINSSYK